MPTYEYVCTSCAHQWEEIQKISADPLEECPQCANRTAKRQITGGNFILKGGGWYADAYSSKPATKEGGAEAKLDAGGGGEAKKDAAAPAPAEKTEKSEAKPKADTKPPPGAGSGTT
jgi:putative FmdB family regulatory protein